jgi:hypothetical protein
MDQARGERHGPERVAARYEPHNCFPWRSTFCVSQSSQGHAHTSTQPQEGQWQPHATDKTLAPTASRNAEWQPQLSPPSTSTARTVGEITEQIRCLLFLYFCEGGENDNVSQRREKSASILREELQRPVMLSTSHGDIDACDEFSRIKTAVESYLEAMCVDGLTLVPELSDDGLQLVIHVSCLV